MAAACAQAAALGFQAVDLIAIPGWQQLDPQAIADDVSTQQAAVQALLAQHGLQAQAINAAVGKPQETAERQIFLTRVRALCRFAQALGSRVISLYPGYLHDSADREAQASRALPCLRDAAAIGRDHGVQVAVEVHWRTPWALPQQALQLVEQQIPLVFDPSHSLAAGEAVEDWREVLPFIVHHHLRDATKDQLHVPWGSGDLNLPELLSWMGTSGTWAAEALPQSTWSVEGDLRNIQNSWRVANAPA